MDPAGSGVPRPHMAWTQMLMAVLQLVMQMEYSDLVTLHAHLCDIMQARAARDVQHDAGQACGQTPGASSTTPPT